MKKKCTKKKTQTGVNELSASKSLLSKSLARKVRSRFDGLGLPELHTRERGRAGLE
jgi:hypothetical protein